MSLKRKMLNPEYTYVFRKWDCFELLVTQLKYMKHIMFLTLVSLIWPRMRVRARSYIWIQIWTNSFVLLLFTLERHCSISRDWQQRELQLLSSHISEASDILNKRLVCPVMNVTLHFHCKLCGSASYVFSLQHRLSRNSFKAGGTAQWIWQPWASCCHPSTVDGVGHVRCLSKTSLVVGDPRGKARHQLPPAAGVSKIWAGLEEHQRAPHVCSLENQYVALALTERETASLRWSFCAIRAPPVTSKTQQREQLPLWEVQTRHEHRNREQSDSDWQVILSYEMQTSLVMHAFAYLDSLTCLTSTCPHMAGGCLGCRWADGCVWELPSVPNFSL